MEQRLSGRHYDQRHNVIDMDKEQFHRHRKWCQSLNDLISRHRFNGNADHFQITWNSPDILEWNPLETVDAVFEFFKIYNQSSDSI